MDELASVRPAALALPAGRDVLWVLTALAAVAALAWAYLLVDVARMEAVRAAGAGAMMRMGPGTGTDLLLLYGMWSVMMVAMMVPTVAPAVLVYVVIVRRTAPQQPVAPSTALFVAGYLLAWAGFSAFAALVQWELGRLAMLSPAMAATSPLVGAALLIGAGVYQWTPLKEACLRHCQVPLVYLAHHWRPGLRGALPMGLHHGLYCIGCCWAIMGLLFVGGVMNLLWVAVLSGVVLLEKLAALGGRAGRMLSGLAAVVAGVAVLAGWV